jgi:hypothetical protein
MARVVSIWSIIVFCGLLAGCAASDSEATGGAWDPEDDDTIDPWPEPDPEVIPFDQVERLRQLDVVHLADLGLVAFVLETDGGVEGWHDADAGVE